MDSWPTQTLDLRGYDAKMALSALRNIEVDNPYVNDTGWRNRAEISSLYAEGKINDLDIEMVFEEAVLTCARRDYEHILHVNMHQAHHIGRPAVLAYALEMGLFNDEEITRIPFDAGQDKEGFIERYGVKNLPKVLAKEFLQPVKPLHIPPPCGSLANFL